MATRLHGVLALSWLALAVPVGALPCGEPGTITTVTAPDGGDYIAAFTGYKIYPTVEEGFQGVDGPVDLVAAPEYRSHYPWYLAAGPQGRVHISDGRSSTASKPMATPPASSAYHSTVTSMEPA